MKIKTILAATLLTSTLSGCGLYTKFDQSPDTEITENLYNYIEATSDTTTIASMKWHELFTDSKLQSLIDLGLTNNTDLNVARLNIEQAEIALKISRKAFIPTLSASGNGKLNLVDGNTTSSVTGTLSSSWEIDIFGRLRNAKLHNKMALEQSVAYHKAVQTQLVASIATNYYSLLLLDEQMRISQRTVEVWNENIRTMEALNKAGRVNKTAVLQSKANKVALESRIIAIDEQIQTLENSLSALLKIAPQHIERNIIADVELTDNLNVGLPIQLLSNRPDVQVAEYELAKAFYATNMARASLYPSLSLSGSAGYSRGSAVISNPGEIIYSFVGSVMQSIFNGGKLRGELNISKSQQEQALLKFNQAVLDAGAEVNTALIACRSAKERVTQEQQQIDLLREAVKDSELLMKHGSSTYLDVLISQQSLLSAELSFANSKFKQTEGVINLYRALGGGAE